MVKEKEVMEKITQVEEGDEMSSFRPQGLAISVTVKGNPSQWQATALWKDSQAGPWSK